MSDKRYPTRMHEVLGVEPFEKFQVVGGYEGRNYSLDKDGWMRWGESNWESDVEDVYNAINHGITRRPRLTEEQVRKLKALYDFGMRWMFFTHSTAHNTWLYATPDWDGQGGWSWNGERLRIKGSPLNDLERVLADAPLDIVQTLRDAGVEIEEDK